MSEIELAQILYALKKIYGNNDAMNLFEKLVRIIAS